MLVRTNNDAGQRRLLFAAAKAIAPRSSDEADEEARKSSASARVAWA